MLGGRWNSEPLPFDVTSVSVVSTEAYEAAMNAASTAAPSVETDVETPQTPTETPAETTTPAEDTTPTAEVPDVPQPEPDDAPQIDTSEPAPTEVEPAPSEIVPPSENLALLVPERSVRPRIKPVERIAPEPVATPAEPDVQPADTPEVDRVEDAPSETPAEPTDAAQPEEATTEIDPEAKDDSFAAPATSVRPKTRPRRAAATEPAETPSTEDAVAGALAEALGESSEEPTPAAPSGPPLTGGEREGLKLAVSRCWNLGALSSEAMAVTIIVAMDMTRDGKPVVPSIKLLSSSGGSDAAANKAYSAARRAIIRCGASGYDLPDEKFEQWRSIEMKFNPESMR
nr:energy transducer TonB [Lentibacter algarum]